MKEEDDELQLSEEQPRKTGGSYRNILLGKKLSLTEKDKKMS